MNAAEEDTFHQKCKDQFLSIKNVSYLTSRLGSEFSAVLANAAKWITPSSTKQANYRLSAINELFLLHLQSSLYEPLGNVLKQYPLPDKEIDRDSMQIRKPYDYLDRAPNIFGHKEFIANIVKNNLPGNQKTRYLQRETSIYDEEQELCNITRKDQTKYIYYK